MTKFNIFHTTRVRIEVRDGPHIWGAGEIRDAGEQRLFWGLARSEPFVTPHIWGTGEMSTEISATYLGRWGNKHWKSRRIYVALGHDELKHFYAKLIGAKFLYVNSEIYGKVAELSSLISRVLFLVSWDTRQQMCPYTCGKSANKPKFTLKRLVNSTKYKGPEMSTLLKKGLGQTKQ